MDVYVSSDGIFIICFFQATKSVRFVTQDEPGPVAGEESWQGEVWAPSLTLGRDGPGILLRDGKVLRTASTDSLTSTQKPSSTTIPRAATKTPRSQKLIN